MPRTPKPPKYRLYKRTGQAVVTLSGVDFYLGKHGTRASREACDELVARFLANGRRLLDEDRDGDLTVVEVIVRYASFARDYDRGSTEFAKVQSVLAHVRALYGRTPARDYRTVSEARS